MSTIHALVDAWLSTNAFPVLSRRMLMATADSYQEANAVGDFLGTNTSNPNAQGREIFADPANLPTAIATIMTHTQNKANFHPAAQKPEELAKYYNDYLVGMDQTPFFHLTRNDQTKQTFKSKDYNKLIDQVTALYEGVDEADKTKIKDSIKQMAKSVFSESHSEEWKNLFSQATIDYANPRVPKLYIYYTTLHMKHDDGKSEVNEQEYTVNRAEYDVLADLIRAYADSLTKLIKVDVDDWITDSSSPVDPKVELCFEKA